ncbi:MAG: GNAT family N-acetyltransferase [Castellaniella sp.]
MTTSVEHNPGQHRFENTQDGRLSVLDYHLHEGLMTITHTGVPVALQGRGIAGALTRTALDTARSEGWRVRPACSYARVWIERHPDYQDLLA